MLAAASIWAIDALFGLVARNDAEWHRRELLGRSWRRDWAGPQIGAKNVGRNKTLVWHNPRFAPRTRHGLEILSLIHI